jgi:hypothetical protein
MLEQNLTRIRTTLERTEDRIQFNQSGLQTAAQALEWLDPQHLASGKPIGSKSLSRLRPRDSMGWEERMGILRRTVRLRERLAGFSVPGFNERITALNAEKTALHTHELSLLDQIKSQLLTDKALIQSGIRDGHLHPRELSWIDSQFERLGLEAPKEIEIKPTAIEIFLRNPKTPAPIKEFGRSSNMPFVLRCTSDSLRDPDIDLKKLRGGLNGYIFEQVAFRSTRTAAVTSGRRSPMQLLSPEVTFDVFRTVHQNKKIITAFHGLFRGIEGVSIPDGIIVALYGGGEAEFFNLVEYSMVNLDRNGGAASEKQRQVDNYMAYDSFAFQSLATWAEGYNKAQHITSSVFGAHPLLAGRKFRVRSPQDGFGLYYYLAENQRAPLGIPKDHIGELKINTSHINNFADAIISTCQATEQ